MDTILNLPGFLIAVFFAFYIPGDLVFHKIGLEFAVLNKMALKIVFGLVLWAWQGYVFYLLGLRNLTYFYLGLLAVVWIVLRARDHLDVLTGWRKKLPTLDLIPVTLIFIGTIVGVAGVWHLGSYQPNGLEFCCLGVPDAIYHLSLVNSLTHLVPSEPGAVGFAIQNYHYWADLVMADLIRIFGLPLEITVYQYFSVLVSFLIGLTAVCLMKVLKFNRLAIFLALIFIYFHSDLVYLLLMLQHKGFNPGIGLIDGAIDLLPGPTRAFSLVVLFSGLTLVSAWMKKGGKLLGCVSVIIFSSLVGFKVYTAVFGFAFLFAFSIFSFKKNQLKFLVFATLAVCLGGLTYFQMTKGLGGLVYVGLGRIHDFALDSQYGLLRLNALLTLANQNHKYFQIGVYELVGVILYLGLNIGVILLGLFNGPRSLGETPKPIYYSLLFGLVVCGILGLFFFQKVGGANTVQFIIGDEYILCFFAALFFSHWLGKFPRKLAIILGILVIAFASTKTVYKFFEVLRPSKKDAGLLVSNEELAPLYYLKNHTPVNSVVMVDPWRSLTESALYFPYVSNRSVYLVGGNTELDHGIPVGDRIKLVDDFYNHEKNLFSSQNLLDQSQVDYVYLESGSSLPVDLNLLRLKKVFQNSKATIYATIR